MRRRRRRRRDDSWFIIPLNKWAYQIRRIVCIIGYEYLKTDNGHILALALAGGGGWFNDIFNLQLEKLKPL